MHLRLVSREAEGCRIREPTGKGLPTPSLNQQFHKRLQIQRVDTRPPIRLDISGDIGDIPLALAEHRRLQQRGCQDPGEPGFQRATWFNVTPAAEVKRPPAYRSPW